MTQRFMNLALVAGAPVDGAWILEGPLRSDDTLHFASGLTAAGFDVRWSGETERPRIEMRCHAGAAPGGEIHCGHGGTMMRFLVAALSTKAGRDWVIDGSPRLRERPIGPLVDALRGLGARVECLGAEGYPPVRVEGGSLVGGRVILDAGLSSQYLSALLMAGLGAERPVEIEVSALVSAPYVELTVEAIEVLGGRVQRRDNVWIVDPTPLQPTTVEVEGDWSSASYWLAGAPLTDGAIRLQGLSRSSRQGDRDFVSVVERLGGRVEWRDDDLFVSRARALTAVDVDLSSMPDLVPTLAAVAPFAAGTTRITNVAHLRIKESDRLAAMALELTRVGGEVEEQEDGLAVNGCWSPGAASSGGVKAVGEVVGAAVGEVTVETHEDHRIAMSLALTGLRRPGLHIGTPEVVEKSYPAFWEHLAGLLADQAER